MTQIKSLQKQMQHSKMRYKLSIPNLPKINTFIEAADEKYKIKNKKNKSKSYRLSLQVLTASFVAFLAYDPIVNFVIDYNFQLRPGGLTTAAWSRNPIPIHSCWYIFGLRNGRSFLNGSKPSLEENGPFCYDAYRTRRILEWKDDSVKYVERFEFTFNPSMSQPLDTQFTMANLPIFFGVMSAKSLMEQFYVGFLGHAVVYRAMVAALRATGEGALERITARQLMEGRRVRMLEYVDAALRPFRALGIPLPDLKQGFLGITNYSVGITSAAAFFEVGPFEAWTRSEAGHTVGHAFKFGDLSSYPAYQAPCNVLGGSDGIFQQKPVVDPHLYFYIHHMCRRLRFDRNVSMYYNGAQVVRYHMDPNIFNSRLKRNQCFCTGDRTWQECDGWANLGPCLFGLPIGISFPHFFANRRRRSEINGLKPNAEKHQGYLLMEPQLGVPVKAKITIQALLQVTPVSSVSELASLQTVKLPLLWIELFAGADSLLLGTALFIGSNSIRYGSYCILLAGIGASGLLFLTRFMK